MIDNNGTIDGLKDPSRARVNSKFALRFDLGHSNINLFSLT